MVVVVIPRLPLALVKLMPVVLLLVEDTLVKVIPRVVAAVTFSAAPGDAFALPFDVIEPVVTLTVPPLAATPVPALVVTVSVENNIVPVFDARFTPVPDVEPLFTVVAPKLKPPAA